MALGFRVLGFGSGASVFCDLNIRLQSVASCDANLEGFQGLIAACIE